MHWTTVVATGALLAGAVGCADPSSEYASIPDTALGSLDDPSSQPSPEALDQDTHDYFLDTDDPATADTVPPYDDDEIPSSSDYSPPGGTGITTDGITSADTALAHAQGAWRALRTQMGVPGHRALFRDDKGSSGLTDAWPYGQVLAAALDIAEITGDPTIARAMRSEIGIYRLRRGYAPTAHPGSTEARFWDDNGWIGLDFVQGYFQRGGHRWLEKAINMYPFMRAGMNPHGGLYWVERGNRNFSMPATGSATEFSLRLYLAAHHHVFRDDGERNARFIADHMIAPNGLVYDVIPAPSNPPFYTYNQGTAIGAFILMHRITEDPAWLDRATHIADASLAYFESHGGFYGRAPSFNAIYFRNLLTLGAITHNTAYRDALDQYLTRAWRDARDAQGLFTRNGFGHYGPRFTVLDQAAMVQMYSLLAMPASALGDLS